MNGMWLHPWLRTAVDACASGAGGLKWWIWLILLVAAAAGLAGGAWIGFKQAKVRGKLLPWQGALIGVGVTLLTYGVLYQGQSWVRKLHAERQESQFKVLLKPLSAAKPGELATVLQGITWTKWSDSERHELSKVLYWRMRNDAGWTPEDWAAVDQLQPALHKSLKDDGEPLEFSTRLLGLRLLAKHGGDQMEQARKGCADSKECLEELDLARRMRDDQLIAMARQTSLTFSDTPLDPATTGAFTRRLVDRRDKQENSSMLTMFGTGTSPELAWEKLRPGTISEAAVLCGTQIPQIDPAEVRLCLSKLANELTNRGVARLCPQKPGDQASLQDIFSAADKVGDPGGLLVVQWKKIIEKLPDGCPVVWSSGQ